MKKYILLMLLLLPFTLTLSACTQSEEEKMQVYLKDKSQNFYDFSVIDFTDGKLNIEFRMLPGAETWGDNDAEFEIAVETKASLEAVKGYAKEHSDKVEEANLYFVTRESNKTVAEINAKHDTIQNTKWLELNYQEFLQIVDDYKFYGVSN